MLFDAVAASWLRRARKIIGRDDPHVPLVRRSCCAGMMPGPETIPEQIDRPMWEFSFAGDPPKAGVPLNIHSFKEID
jgi:hypothetical protein